MDAQNAVAACGVSASRDARDTHRRRMAYWTFDVDAHFITDFRER